MRRSPSRTSGVVRRTYSFGTGIPRVGRVSDGPSVLRRLARPAPDVRLNSDSSVYARGFGGHDALDLDADGEPMDGLRAERAGGRGPVQRRDPLALPSTRTASRSGEFYQPLLMGRVAYDAWHALGRPSMYGRARDRVSEILAGPVADPLPDRIVEELDRILAEADRDLRE